MLCFILSEHILSERHCVFVLFAEFASPSDNNSQGCLKFDAFYRMQPGALRKQFTPEQIKQWFDFADEDGDSGMEGSLDEAF